MGARVSTAMLQAIERLQNDHSITASALEKELGLSNGSLRHNKECKELLARRDKAKRGPKPKCQHA